MTSERNFCAESECPGACCSNVKLNGVSSQERKLVFPMAVRVEESQLGKKVFMIGGGVYFALTDEPLPRNISVQIVGKCPRLNNNGSCDAQGFKPKACENELFGGDLCDDKRLAIALPTVDKNLAAQARLIQRMKDLQDFADSL